MLAVLSRPAEEGKTSKAPLVISEARKDLGALLGQVQPQFTLSAPHLSRQSRDSLSVLLINFSDFRSGHHYLTPRNASMSFTSLTCGPFGASSRYFFSASTVPGGSVTCPFLSVWRPATSSDPLMK